MGGVRVFGRCADEPAQAGRGTRGAHGGWQQPPTQDGGGWGAPTNAPGAQANAYAAQPAYAAQQGGQGGWNAMPSAPAPISTGAPRGFGDASSSARGAGGGGFGQPMSPRSLAAAGLGMYGGKFLNDGASFVSSNYAKYFSTASMRAYFDVTESYVFHKLRLLLCPFLHKGSWARLPESVAGGTAYKPPRNDINAPDLYIPLMAFWTYVLTASIREVFSSKSGAFTPEALATHAWWSGLLWSVESAFIWIALRTASTSNHIVSAPMLDIAAYVGYSFVYGSVTLMSKFSSGSLIYWLFLSWSAVCNAVFMAKTLKKIIFSESRHGGYSHSMSHNYVLLCVVIVQFPIHFCKRLASFSKPVSRSTSSIAAFALSPRNSASSATITDDHPFLHLLEHRHAEEDQKQPEERCGADHARSPNRIQSHQHQRLPPRLTTSFHLGHHPHPIPEPHQPRAHSRLPARAQNPPPLSFVPSASSLRSPPHRARSSWTVFGAEHVVVISS
ncbi:YIF1-domain-containing protein [Ostreococcus tauri]|uniref:YIF1-domain-containing protein n=1 Tax=Ostreococcus tauri TaxID=70448 RepID=A0A1Y5HY07_OSTTA|nr:YIF1-domain-containing protein [Ostreococcus tauri]